ncbi:MAG: ATP-binding cassette domain-containing protein [Gemmataceae bacterium]|nr:ATP-binding cassette domain-containing protein [Gemmataceae bacterium]MDW8265906.1 ATP-binding cassette domain-containing protein [Gemmataceae bacterium]
MTARPRSNDTADKTAASPDAQPEPTASNLTVLQILAQAAGVPLDVTRAKRALRQAEIDISPTAARASRQRLVQAAQALGLQLLSRQLSIREALNVVEPEVPLALFAAASDGSARWFVLTEERGGRGRLARVDPTDSDELLTAEELARRLNAATADTVLEWLFAQPAAPLAEASVQSGSGVSATGIPAEAHHGPPPLNRLFGLLRPERQDLWHVVAYAVAVGFFNLATPIALMAVVNTVALATLVQQLIVLCSGLLICQAMVALFRFLQAVVVEYIQRRIFTRVAADISYRLARVRLDAFDRQHGPELVNRFFDVLTVQKASATLLLDGVDVVLSTIIGLALLASYHQVLLGFDIVLLAALVFLFWPLGRGAVATAIRESRAKYAVAAWLEEIARHPSAFKLAGGPQFATDRTDILTREYLLARHAHFRIVMRQFAFALAVNAIALTVLLALGGFLVIYGQLTLGQLVAAELVVSLVVLSFTKFSKHLESYYDLLAAVEKLGVLVDLPLERTRGVAHHARSGGASVLIHDLSFTYEGGHRPALHQFNLTLEAGERVALWGPNGAGKSTLVDLLFGLRVPTHGYIEIDGMDLRELQLESLRAHVAVVRGIEIFEASVLDNVRMGRDELSVADVRQALKAVGLLQVVLELPDGLYTRLRTGGSPLSLGQAARLMLARAIVGQPRLLVLDDVLDSIDQDSRREVLPVIMGRDARWTLLVMTQNPEVAALCDRQVRLDPVTDASLAALAGGHALMASDIEE